MTDNNKSGITIDYLIDLISSVKSALHNIDDKNSQNHDILIELSATINVLTELYKKQNQDQKTTQEKLEETIRSVRDLASKIEIHKQQILSSNEAVNSKVSVINEFKKESLDDITQAVLSLNETILNLQGDVSYLKNRENQKELVLNLKMPVESKSQSETKEGITSKIIGLLKTMSTNVGDIYKIMMLVVGVLLVILWLTGFITASDLKNIVQLKFF